MWRRSRARTQAGAIAGGLAIIRGASRRITALAEARQSGVVHLPARRQVFGLRLDDLQQRPDVVEVSFGDADCARQHLEDECGFDVGDGDLKPDCVADGKIAALIAALESGVAVDDLTAALRCRTAERDELKARLERAERPCAMSAAQIGELVEKLGGLSVVLSEATGSERAQVYASLGLRLDYDPHLQRVTATADLGRVAGRVRGGT